MLLVQQAIQATGGLTGDLKKDRDNIRTALSQVKKFNGITGEMTFAGKNDPTKCAVIVKISDAGEFTFYKSVCP
jgi:branched-chain amino acid transport system substrate-binding protein